MGFLLLTAATGFGRGPDLSVMNDAKAHTDARIKAIRATWDAVRDGETSAADAREMLKRVAWSRGTYFKVRGAAIEALLDDEPNIADTRNMLRLMLPTETQWEVIEQIANTAGAGGWTELAPALVRSWSRPVLEPPDDQRPERKALEKMFPERSPEESVFMVFSGAIEGSDILKERDRLDAYALLRRVDTSGERTRALLAGDAVDTNDELVLALRAGARELRAVPDTGEQLDWLRRLRAPANQVFWTEASAALAQLRDDQTAGLGLRHAAIVRWTAANRPQWMSASRDGLYEEVKGMLAKTRKHPRVHDSMSGDAKEMLRDWQKELCWGDLLTLRVALDVLGAPAIASSCFHQADKDLLDRSTEHGGLITDSGGGVAAVSFLPRASQRAGDMTFVAPNDMIEGGDTALFHYHFHANRHTNSEYAGPSKGDIETARSLGRASLVMTFVRKDALNVDYYQGDGIRVDLGEIVRAAAPAKPGR